MRGYKETANVITGAALTSTSGGGRTTFTKELPLGEGWYAMHLHFNMSLTVGTAATTRAESLLRYIQNIQLTTSAGEKIVDLPAAALWDIAKVKAGTNPAVYTDAAPATMISPPTMPATTAVYNVEIPIYFTDPDLSSGGGRNSSGRKEDTVLDTSRYSSVTLDVQMGGFTDLFAAPGTMSIVNTLDVEIVRGKGPLPKEAKPISHIQYGYRQPVDAFNTTLIDMERSPDLWLRRAYFHTVTGGTAVPWGGPAAVKSDVVLDVVNIIDQAGYIVKQRKYEAVRDANKRDLSLEVGFVGVGVFDLIDGDSINSALATGNKSVLQFTYTPVTGLSAGSYVTLATESHRTLK